MKVQHQEGNNVNIIKEGKVTSVPIQRTQPAGGRQAVRNILEAPTYLFKEVLDNGQLNNQKEENIKEQGKIDIPGIRSSLIRSELSLMLWTKHIVSLYMLCEP